MGILNLPQPGLATGILAKSWGNTIDQKREDEKEKTKMIGNAILQQAQSGNFTDEGYQVILKQYGPGVAETFKKTAEQAKQKNDMNLASMKQEKTLLSLKMRAADLDLIEKLDKVNDPETVKMVIGKWNELQDLTGSNAHISPLMEIADRNAQVKKSVTETINKSIAKAEKEPTVDSLSEARKDLISFAKRMDPGIAALYEKRIAAASRRLEKKEGEKTLERIENEEAAKARGQAMGKPSEVDKTRSKEQLTRGALTAELGREPTDAEVLKRMEESDLRVAGAKAVTVERAKFDAQTGMASAATIDQWADYFMTSGELPPEVGRLFRTPGAQWDVINKINERVRAAGGAGDERAVERAMYKAGQSSLVQQQKQRGAAGNFVRNIDKQIDRLDNYIDKLKKINRIGARGLDLPKRELLKRVAGSAEEVVVEAYLTEISNEIGKLSTGSQASIAELSVGAQEKWAKIHDPNLSIREIKEILSESSHMGKMRVDSMDEEIEFTRNKLKKKAVSAAPEKTGPSRAEWMKAAKAANPGTSVKELNEYYDKKYGK